MQYSIKLWFTEIFCFPSNSHTINLRINVASLISELYLKNSNNSNSCFPCSIRQLSAREFCDLENFGISSFVIALPNLRIFQVADYE